MFNPKTNTKKDGVFFMYNSIQHFLNFGVKKISDEATVFYENPENFSDFVVKVKEDVLGLGLAIISEELENMDNFIRNSSVRKQKWVVVRKDETSLITSLGMVRYHKTMFKNKKNGERRYLLDEFMKLHPHERITTDAIAEMLQEATETSYRRGGEETSLTDSVSKQTVKNVVHSLKFPEIEYHSEKKKVKKLFICADEDHVALQFKDERGDLEPAPNGRVYNNCISKLVYVYEDCIPEAPKSKRNKLVNPYYFSGMYEGTEENRRLWKDVADYIENTYEIEESGHIFLYGDGGAWINAAKEVLPSNLVMLLDKFHLMKYINQAVSHMGDSVDDAKDYLIDIFKSRGTKNDLDNAFGKLYKFAEDNKTRNKIDVSYRYIRGNWGKICNDYRYKYHHGCNAEGHVSHVLSGRLSSRPMGWSKLGIDKMSKLRAYRANGKDFMELAKFQREEYIQATELEDISFSLADVLLSERANKHTNGKYYDKYTAHIAGNTARKILSIREKIYTYN